MTTPAGSTSEAASSSWSTALITGAAGDIGSAAAAVLASAGHRVLLADHPSAASRLHELADRMTSEGADVMTALFDVTDRAAVRSAFDGWAAASHTPTLIYNNAGYQGSFAPVHLLDPSDIARVLTVNVVGVLHVIAEAASRLITLGASGAIVNSASMAGVSGAPNMAAYSASKAAVIGLTKSCAKDLAPYGIRVNSVSPAFIGPGVMWERQVAQQAETHTQYFSADPDEVARQMLAMIPMRRLGSTSEVADVVAYLLSDAASYVTSVNIEITGGSS